MSSATPTKQAEYYAAWFKSFLERIIQIPKSESVQYSFPQFNQKSILPITNMLLLDTPLYDAILTISNHFQFSSEVVSKCCLIDTKQDITDEMQLAFLCCCISIIRQNLPENDISSNSNTSLIFSPLCTLLKLQFSTDLLCVFLLITKFIDQNHLECITTDDVTIVCNIIRKNISHTTEHPIFYEIICSLLNSSLYSGARISISSLSSFTMFFIQNSISSDINYNILLEIIENYISPTDGDVNLIFSTICDVYKTNKEKFDITKINTIVSKLAKLTLDIFFTQKEENIEKIPKNCEESKFNVTFSENDDDFYEKFKSLNLIVNEDNENINVSVTTESIEEKYLSEICLECLGVLRPLISAATIEMKEKYLEVLMENYEKTYSRTNITENLVFYSFILCLSISVCEFDLKNDRFDAFLVYLAKNTFLFSEDLSIYFKTDEKLAKNIFEIRSYFIYTLINHFPHLFITVLSLFEDTFYMIIEILHVSLHFITNNEKTIIEKTITKKFADLCGRTLQKVTMSYICHPNLQKIWSNLFDILISMLPLKSEIFFSSSEFLFILLCHLLSENCQTNILTVFRNHLFDGSYLADSLPHIIEKKNFPYKIMSLLFEQINDNLSSRPTYLESYKKVSQYVYSHYVTFPDSFGSLSLLITFIIGDLIELKLSEKYLLCQRIRDSSKSDNDISMNVASHCLLLSRKNVSQKGLILIEEPSFILPVLLIGESLKNSLTFYKNLGDYSSTNCYQFHKGRLDLFLLEVIKVFQKSDTLQFDDNSFKIDFGADFVEDLVFPLLSHIMNFGCNFEVLQKVTEINMTEESKYGDQLLNLITMTLCEKQRISKITHIFCKENKALTFDLTTDFSCGFSFSCWVFFDKVYSEVSCSQCTIFSLIFSEGYGDGISCFLSGTSLHAILFSRFGTSSSSIVLCPNFPSNQWTLITLSVRPRGDENAQIGFSINAEKSLAFLVRDAISKGSSNVRIGGMRKLNTKKSKIVANSLCKLGPFRLVQYSKQIKQEMVEMYSRPESMDGDLIPLINIEEVEDKESVLSVVKTKKFLSDCLLKLFSLSEKRNGEFIVRLLDILRFSDFKNSQELIRCFSSYLTQSAKILPFRVFSCCSDIYESTKDVNFLCRVLFNLELWLETSQSICSRCLQQLTVVSQNYASIVFSFYNFRFLLSVFRKSVENKEKDFPSCQKILFNCVQFKGLTDSDSISLAGHIAMSCLEGREKLTVFFLQTLQGICDFISDKILFKITSILCKTFKESKSVASSFYVISVMTMILEKRIGNDANADNDDDESIFDAEDCLFLLQSSLTFPDKQFGKELNDKLLEKCQDQPLLIHYILKISSILEIKPDFSVFYEKNFSFSDKATKVNFWPLWATKYASLYSEEGSNLIFRLFISKPSQILSDLILTFFSFYGSSGHRGLSVFVQLCSKHLTSSHDRQLISSIVSRAATILCLSRDSHSIQILTLFEDSEFNQNMTKIGTDKMTTEDEIFGCLKKVLCLRSPSPVFSSLVITLNNSFQAIPAQLAEFCRFALTLHTKGGISASRSLCGCAQSVYSYSMNDYNAHCLPKVNKLFQRYTKIMNEFSLIKDGIIKATHDIARLVEFDRNENILASNTLKEYGLFLAQSQ